MAHQYDLVCYFYAYTISDEQGNIIHRGVGHANSGPNKDETKQHILYQHPRMKVTEIHRCKDHVSAMAEVEAAKQELAKDPNWIPWTTWDVQASRNADIHPNPPVAPTIIQP